MAFTIADSFARLRSNLEITDFQSTLVSTRQQTIRKTIDNGLKVLDDFLTGSYARSTMISPLSEADIDIFVCLDPAYYTHFNGINGGPAGLLELAKQTIRKTYSTTPDISRNGQAVTIRFSDFVVDVVIGFHRLGGGYIIANSEGNFWLNTDPKKHVELMSEANKYHKGNLVPLIKMIKSWNKAHGAFFRSFHLEVLALEAFRNVTISDFPSGLRFFFEKAFTLVRGKNLDPAGYGDDIGRYITPSTVEEASRKFQGAFNTAINAEVYGNRGDPRNAIITWKALMPNHFPAYG
jgi:Second Messenger Oligonucleotide or Dinucleotide Synthetase domain